MLELALASRRERTELVRFIALATQNYRTSDLRDNLPTPGVRRESYSPATDSSRTISTDRTYQVRNCGFRLSSVRRRGKNRCARPSTYDALCQRFAGSHPLARFPPLRVPRDAWRA